MNPSIRRYIPVVAIVALLLVAVYFGQPDRMTGSAAGAGCAGSQGQFVAENEAGTVTTSAQDSVRAVLRFDSTATDAGEITSLDDLKLVVEEMGADALPALLEELRDTGCMTTNSAELIDLVQVLGDQPDFDGQLYGVLADTLLEVATMALDNAGDGDSEMSIEALDGGKGDRAEMQADVADAGADSAPEMQAQDVAAGGRTFEGGPAYNCAADALEVVQIWAASKLDGNDFVKKLEQQIDGLEPGAKSALELVELLAELAPHDEDWARAFETMALDQEMDKDARGLACDAAVARESELTAMRDDLSLLTSPPAAVCLLEASVAFEDASVASWGLKHEEPTVRFAALSVFREIGGDDDVTLLLMHLFPALGEEPNGFEDSERGLTVKAIAAVVAESETNTNDLLSGAMDLSAQAQELGSIWLDQLAQAVGDWESELKQ